MDSQVSVTLHPRELLREVALSMNRRYDNLSVTIPIRTTWRAAIQAAEAALGDIDEPFLAMPPGTGSRRQLREMALQSTPSDSPLERGLGLPIRSNVDIRMVQPHPPPTESARQRLREMAREAAQEDFRQPYISLRAGLIDGHIPTVRGILVLQGVDGQPDDPSYKVETDMIFDTGAHRTIIAEDLLSEEFRQHLKEPVYDPYRSTGGLVVQVETRIALSDHPVLSQAVACVVPTSQMPNERVGVLFGQSSCIDRFNLRLIPRRILEAKGEEISGGVWGDIMVKEYLNMDDEVVTL
ncbi:hypothetical protein NUU61_007189 [Penicillium alfredii]|uniref:Peptidase A2 domain-containing protein n=1 Tax=Penicillium alfredii TaxID=1506179 RepID=A0A9W9F2E1_9EURO|nr:uncharacterized protein NUU61_007189 [Penicillium alfredii]KAJ5092319.1 hypothetical protein NUU61_007189 [Penicillium alfredii]